MGEEMGGGGMDAPPEPVRWDNGSGRKRQLCELKNCLHSRSVNFVFTVMRFAEIEPVNVGPAFPF